MIRIKELMIPYDKRESREASFRTKVRKHNKYIYYVLYMLKGLVQPSMSEHPTIKQLRFNIENMKNTFKEFQEKIQPIETLEKGDKLAMNSTDKIFEVHPAGSLQSFQRWWNAESRTKTLEHLNTNFLEYMRFIDMCVDATRAHPYEQCFIELCYENVEFQNRVREGLDNLRETYMADAKSKDADAIKICKYINVLMATMDEFKSSVIRRAYRRLRLNTYTRCVEVTEIDNVSLDKKSRTDESGNNVDLDKLEKNDVLNSLDLLARVYPGSESDLERHVEAVEKGEEETSSYYDSENEEKFHKEMRERIKQRSTYADLSRSKAKLKD
jgi:hypothetical protein